jgi:hypothetical protein
VIADEIGINGFKFVQSIIFRRSRLVIIDGRKKIPNLVKFRNSRFGKFKETT